jgi:hypothetical protein
MNVKYTNFYGTETEITATFSNGGFNNIVANLEFVAPAFVLNGSVQHQPTCDIVSKTVLSPLPSHQILSSFIFIFISIRVLLLLVLSIYKQPLR